jgi:hypothetical protein
MAASSPATVYQTALDDAAACDRCIRRVCVYVYQLDIYTRKLLAVVKNETFRIFCPVGTRTIVRVRA